MSNIVSPVTGSNNVSFIENIDSQMIIKLYQDDYRLDVSRYFNNIPNIQIYQCLDSGLRFYAPDDTAGDEQFYADFQEVLGNYYKPFRWEYSVALDMIKKEDKVLEIGTGSGIFFEKLSAKVDDCLGLELSNKAIENARQRGLNVINELIEVHAEKHENTYDVVCFFQVLEHITNVKSFLEGAIKCLKPGGKLIIAVPNNNPHIYRYEKYYTSNLPPHHAGLWDKNSLKNLSNFFHINTLSVKIEPLFGMPYQIKVWAKHHNLNFIATLIDKSPKIVIKALGKFAPFFDGVNVMGIYEKK